MNTTPNAIILSEGHTATTDYYLIPHLEKSGYCISLLDYRQSPPPVLDFSNCQLLIISRYISYQWLTLLKKLQHTAIKIIYFMDDDLFDFSAIKVLTLSHQYKVISKAYQFQHQLMRLCSEFWVSTPYLAEKYAKFHPRLLNPGTCNKTLQRKQTVHVCYHGSSSHQQEIFWLIPIIEQVQARSNHIHFELFGTPVIQRKLENIPRISLLHSMSWPNYLDFTATEQRDIALAPLLGNAFNAARAPTKFYDYARLQAIGLYSNVAPYRDFIRDGEDGFLLVNDPAVWVEKLLQCADDASQWEKMRSQIQHRLQAE